MEMLPNFRSNLAILAASIIVICLFLVSNWKNVLQSPTVTSNVGIAPSTPLTVHNEHLWDISQNIPAQIRGRNISEHIIEDWDGLRNEDVVVFVASTISNEAKYVRDRIVPSARTWMKHLVNVFVMIEGEFYYIFLVLH